MKTSSYVIADTDIVLTDEFRVVSPFNNVQSEGRKYILKIRDLPNEDKPREKLTAAGPSTLSSQELLAVVLGTGTTKEDVLSMTTRVLKEYGERILSRQTDATRLAAELDIPVGKALQIVACVELGKRFFQENPTHAPVIRTANDVFEYVHDMRSLPKEHMRGIYLNAHHKVIHDEVVSVGTANASLIHPREVFKPAVEYGAAAVILAHNHPSGVIEPSQEDIDVTAQLIAAGKILGIPLIDHVIVGKDSFKSIDADYS